MKAKILRILFCIAILIGTLLGNDIKEKNVLFSPTMQETDGTENVSEAVTAEHSATENAAAIDVSAEKGVAQTITENASGLPLKEDTVLLVTVKRTADWILEEYEYDAEGRMLRYLDRRYVRDEDIEYEYDEDGNLILETCYELYMDENDSEIMYWIEYIYGTNEAGEVIRAEWEYYRDGSLHSQTVYDDEGERLKEISYWQDGQISSVYEYDPSKRQLWLTDYDKEGNTERKYRTDYDDRGNEILRVEYDGEGKISPVRDCACDPEEYIPYWRFENSYDESGNLVRQIVYDIDDIQTGHMENTYDDGRLIRAEEYDAENNLLYYSEYVYDEKGDAVSYFSVNEYGTEKVERAYEYDSYGHCVKYSAVNYWGDDEGNLTKGYPYVIWERKYDADNRLIRYIDQDRDKYYYTYTAIGDLDEDFPYDKIKVR